jgi:hypothetical protein
LKLLLRFPPNHFPRVYSPSRTSYPSSQGMRPRYTIFEQNADRRDMLLSQIDLPTHVVHQDFHLNNVLPPSSSSSFRFRRNCTSFLLLEVYQLPIVLFLCCFRTWFVNLSAALHIRYHCPPLSLRNVTTFSNHFAQEECYCALRHFQVQSGSSFRMYEMPQGLQRRMKSVDSFAIRQDMLQVPQRGPNPFGLIRNKMSDN